MSRQIDWSSTLVVPFPEGLDNVVRVQVGDAQGLMVISGNRPEPGLEPNTNIIIYWQHGDRFYILQGTGSRINADSLLLAAKSVQ